jgi:hypothetical protein
MKQDYGDLHCDTLSQANAPQMGCLLADCASGLSLANNRLDVHFANVTSDHDTSKAINGDNQSPCHGEGKIKKNRGSSQ